MNKTNKTSALVDVTFYRGDGRNTQEQIQVSGGKKNFGEKNEAEESSQIHPTPAFLFLPIPALHIPFPPRSANHWDHGHSLLPVYLPQVSLPPAHVALIPGARVIISK